MASPIQSDIPSMMAAAQAAEADVSAVKARDAKANATTCPLCGSAETRFALRDGACELRVCSICELFFVHPYPESARQHGNVRNGHNPEIEILDCERRHQGERLYYDRHFDSIARECAEARTILDVGCGTGNLLERLRGEKIRDRRCTGIELNASAAAYARRTSHCEIVETPFEEFVGGEKFDAITMINVFSHIPSFDALFGTLRRSLNPGGKAILRTAEMSGNVRRWNQLHWGIPDDLHFLGLGTLDFLCAKYGFVVTRHQRLAYEDELFRLSRWKQPGRSRLVNALKLVGVQVPGVLPALKRIYTWLFGRRIFISFIVLTPLTEGSQAGMRSTELARNATSAEARMP
jgi:SAM-dependent methyltransferase